MASVGSPSRSALRDANWDRAHSDINVLAQRVTGLENAIAAINNSVGELSKKLDPKPPNFIGLIAAGAAILSVIGGFLLQGKAPLDASLERHDREIGRLMETAVTKEEFRQFEQQSTTWNSRLGDRVRADEDVAVTARQIGEMKDNLNERDKKHSDVMDDVKKRVDSIDADLIKRPEINSITNALDGRINALSARLNEIQHDVGSNYTLGDLAKSLSERVDRIQMQINTMSPPITLAPPKS